MYWCSHVILQIKGNCLCLTVICAAITCYLLQVVELPYSDEKYNMYIFMAESGKLKLSFMESIISQLTIPAFKQDFLKDQDRPLRIVLPKFKISSELDISRALYNIGVKKLFTPEADLSGIFEDYPAHFNKMFHKSVIEVGFFSFNCHIIFN